MCMTTSDLQASWNANVGEQAELSGRTYRKRPIYSVELHDKMRVDIQSWGLVTIEESYVISIRTTVKQNKKKKALVYAMAW